MKEIDRQLNRASQSNSSLFERAPSLVPNNVRRAMTAGRMYSLFVDTVTVLNILQMGLSLDLHGSGWNQVWFVCDIVVAAVFFIDMVIRIREEKLSFFRNYVNIVDSIVAWVAVFEVVLSLTDITSHAGITAIQLLRLARLARLAKLLHVFPAFRVITESVLASIKAMSWLLCFLIVTMYAVAIVCVLLIGSQDAGYPGYDTTDSALYDDSVKTFNNYKYFGTIWRSMVSLFHLIMLSDEMTEVNRATGAVQPWLTLVFMLFILLTTLCLLNTMVGVIVEKTVSLVLEDDKAAKEMKARQMSAVQDLSSLMFDLDLDGNSELSISELRLGAKSECLRHLLQMIELPAGFSVEELFDMLDLDSSGTISRNEFIGGLFRLVFSSPFQRECLARLGETNVKRCVLQAKEEIISEMRTEHSRMMSEIRALMSFSIPVESHGEFKDVEHKRDGVNASPPCVFHVPPDVAPELCASMHASNDSNWVEHAHDQLAESRGQQSPSQSSVTGAAQHQVKNSFSSFIANIMPAGSQAQPANHSQPYYGKQMHE